MGYRRNWKFVFLVFLPYGGHNSADSRDSPPNVGQVGDVPPNGSGLRRQNLEVKTYGPIAKQRPVGRVGRFCRFSPGFPFVLI